ncbi:Uncharacterised protein [Vibrio cholerae]|nr:Uncharacterised protein [Vibrio cholerae]
MHGVFIWYSTAFLRYRRLGFYRFQRLPSLPLRFLAVCTGEKAIVKGFMLV